MSDRFAEPQPRTARQRGRAFAILRLYYLYIYICVCVYIYIFLFIYYCIFSVPLSQDEPALLGSSGNRGSSRVGYNSTNKLGRHIILYYRVSTLTLAHSRQGSTWFGLHYMGQA